MRKFLISILLAGAAASPALAQDNADARPHRDQQQKDKGQAREERHQERDQARSERANGGANAERQQQRQGEAGGFDRSRIERVNSAPPAQMPPQEFNRSRFGRVNSPPPVQAPQQEFDRSRFERVNSPPPVQHYRRQNGFSGGQPQQVDQADGRNWRRDGGDARRGDPNVMRTRGPLVVSSVPREGTQPPPRIVERRWGNTNWNRNWPDNDRYDWRDWRRSHRTIFRIGLYYDPFGWGYRPYQIGWRLWPSYYNQQYWINDPWMYRLPYAPPGLVWVRYWDDALLIDTYSGEVVDVIHNFFW